MKNHWTSTSVCLLLFLAQGWTAVADKPNILWIITDDQRSDSLACYNRATTGKSESALGYVESPHVDRLVARWHEELHDARPELGKR